MAKLENVPVFQRNYTPYPDKLLGSATVDTETGEVTMKLTNPEWLEFMDRIDLELPVSLDLSLTGIIRTV